MIRRGDRGFTFVELLVVIGILVAVAVVTAGLAKGIQRTDRHSADYVDDVNGLRRAVRTIEADLRKDGEPRHDYRLEDGRLLRDGQVLARNVGRFEMSHGDGLTQVRLGVGRRARVPVAKRPDIVFYVRSRPTGEQR